MDELQITYAIGPDGKRTATLPEASMAYVSAFIRDTARGTTNEIAAAIQHGHDAVIANIEGVSDEQAAFAPAPGEWSILDTMGHIVTVKRICGALATSLAAGQLPPGFGPHLEGETRRTASPSYASRRSRRRAMRPRRRTPNYWQPSRSSTKRRSRPDSRTSSSAA